MLKFFQECQIDTGKEQKEGKTCMKEYRNVYRVST